MKPDLRATNPAKRAMNLPGASEKKSDIYYRLGLLILFGMAAIGFTLRRNISSGSRIFACLYSLAFITIILEGTHWLQKKIGAQFEWHKSPAKRILAIAAGMIAFNCGIGWVGFKGWQLLFGASSVSSGQVILVMVIMLFWIFIITHFYETADLVRRNAGDVISKEQLERLSVEAELELLKSQIDPHFMFNSLNTLSHLIETAPQRALAFNEALADIYRYILLNKGKKMVLLSEEIVFLKDYFALMKIRFGDAIDFSIQLDESKVDEYLIPPISLQILLENAVKHNDFSIGSPLQITLKQDQERIRMTNRHVPKMQHRASAGTGLKNLQERYLHLTGHIPIIDEQNGYFNVTIPIIKTDSK